MPEYSHSNSFIPKSRVKSLYNSNTTIPVRKFFFFTINEYSTVNFIGDLIEEVSKLSPKKVNLAQLNKILRQNSQFLSEVIYRITNSNCKNYNPDYKFSLERLNKFKNHLTNYMKEKSNRCLSLIDKYRKINKDLKQYSKQQWSLHNSNLRDNYFKNIDTIEKGYWFGFLCADGSMQVQSNDKIRYRISFELSFNDKERLLAFCKAIGLNTDKVKERNRTIQYGKKITNSKTAYIEFTCKPMSEYLERHGFLKLKKGQKIIDSIFDNRKIVLGFLLGYYDGDGSQGKTEIVSKNKLFLKQIKEKLNIKSKIIKIIDLNRINDNCLKGYQVKHNYNVWKLSLGAELFNEIMNNYAESLLRKRKFFYIEQAYKNLKKK
jgi:hypothetical protein